MSLEPLLSAGPIVFIHVVVAMIAVFGGMQFILPKGTALHRTIGYIWVIAMTLTALTSFFISEIRPWGLYFSSIHILSVVVLCSLTQAIYAIRVGKIGRHKAIMTSLYFTGVLVPGAFTFIPRRIMHEVFFGPIF